MAAGGMSFGFAVQFDDQITAGAKSARSAVNSLLKAITKLQSVTAAAPVGLGQWTGSLNQATAASNRTLNAMNNLTGGLRQTGRQARETGSSFGIATNGFTTMARAFIGANVAIVTSKLWRGVESLADGFNSAIKAGMEFGKEMALVRVLVDGAADPAKLAQLEKRALSISNTTTFSAKEVAQGMGILGQQGANANEVMSQIPNVLNLAQAGFVSTEQSAKLLSDTLSIYNKSVKGDATVAANLLTAGFNVTKFNALDLQSALRTLGGSSVALGLDLKDSIGLLNLFKEKGYQSGQAGTVLSKVLGDIQVALSGGKNATKIQGALSEVGLTLKDLDPKLVGTSKMLENLQKAFIDTRRSTSAFTPDVGRKLSNALTGATEVMGRYNKALENVATAQEFADNQTATWAGQTTLLKNKLTNLGILFSQEVEKFAVPFLKVANNVVENVMPVFRVFFNMVVRDAGSFLSKLFGKLGEWSSFFKTLVLKNTDDTRAAIKEVQQQLVVRFILASVIIKKFFSGFVDGFKKAWGVIGDVWDRLSGFFGAIKEFFGLQDTKKGKAFNAKDLGEAVGYWTTMATAVGGVLFLASLFSLLFGGWVKLMILGAVLIIAKWEPIKAFFLGLFDIFNAFEALWGKPLEETAVGRMLGLESGKVSQEELLAARINLRRGIQAGFLEKEGVTGTPLIGGMEGKVFTKEEVDSLPPLPASASQPLRSVSPQEQAAAVANRPVAQATAGGNTINVHEGAFQAVSADWDDLSKKLLPAMQDMMAKQQRQGGGAP